MIRLIIFGFLWAMLTDWQLNSIALGFIFVLLASLLSVYLAKKQRTTNQWLKSPSGVFTFIVYFMRESLRGGWEIAKLAFKPTSRLSPGLVTFQSNLASESQVFTFMQVLSLLPGTVSAKQQDNVITIHVLNTASFNVIEIEQCQHRIRRLLGTPRFTTDPAK